MKGTPTIRLYKPKTKQGNSNRKKVVLDYNQERKAKDMKKFVDYAMPNFVECVKHEEGLKAFEEKAERNGLPRALLFTAKVRGRARVDRRGAVPHKYHYTSPRPRAPAICPGGRQAADEVPLRRVPTAPPVGTGPGVRGD